MSDSYHQHAYNISDLRKSNMAKCESEQICWAKPIRSKTAGCTSGGTPSSEPRMTVAFMLER